MSKFKITIEVEGGKHYVKVEDDAGNVKEGNACVISVGNTETRELYLFAWGHPKDATWSLTEGMAQSQGNPWWDGFISSLCRDMAMRTVNMDNVRPNDLLERWEEEDRKKEEEFEPTKYKC